MDVPHAENQLQVWTILSKFRRAELEYIVNFRKTYIPVAGTTLKKSEKKDKRRSWVRQTEQTFGTGKGYCDAYLKCCLQSQDVKPYPLALAFKEQICLQVPVDENDVKKPEQVSTEDGTAHRPSAAFAFLATFPARGPAHPQRHQVSAQQLSAPPHPSPSSVWSRKNSPHRLLFQERNTVSSLMMTAQDRHRG
ncbi:hypothetical protein AB1E19_018838 [Capra hircus]